MSVKINHPVVIKSVPGCLLEGNIPVSDMRSVIKIRAAGNPMSQDTDALGAVADVGIRRSIYYKINRL